MERFIKRVPELLALEGWYDTGEYKFKLSCRFKDILRCSEFNDKSVHFTSCFREGGIWNEQPRLRCLNPNWAIIYTPDKHGNFLGRAFVHLEKNDDGVELVVDKVYGNRLKFKDIDMKIKMLHCRDGLLDTYLSREAS